MRAMDRLGAQDEPHLWGLLGVCVGALNAVGSPLYVVSDTGKLFFANQAGEYLLQCGNWIRLRCGRLVTVQPGTGGTSLQDALEGLRTQRRSLVQLSDSEAVEALITVVPLRLNPLRLSHTEALQRVHERSGSEADVALGLLWFSSTVEPNRGAVEHLAQLFGLTPAEQSLLCSLVVGEKLRAAAQALGISIHTARNQLKAIQRKTGRRTQAQLLTLVNRVSSLKMRAIDSV